MKPKKEFLCYILPEYNQNTEQHFAHLYRFLEALSSHYQIILIIERSVEPVTLQGMTTIWKQRQTQTFLRALEIAIFLWRAHWRGCRLFYTHYSSFGGFLAAILTRAWGGRSFYWNCETNKDHWVSWSLKHLKTKLKIEIPTYLTIYWTHHLVTGTPTMARYYEKVYHLKKGSTRVMPNWILPQTFQHASAEGTAYLQKLRLTTDPVILFVHRMAPRKGALHLPWLIQEIRKIFPTCQFLLVGAGPSQSFLEKEFQSLPQVHLTGRLPNHYLPAFYQRADLFIMPSEQEGFPRVLLEAMQHRIPFVCTDVGGVRDILNEKQREFMVKKGDMPAFLEKVLHLLRFPEWRKSLAQEGEMQQKKFTQEIALQHFVQIVRKNS